MDNLELAIKAAKAAGEIITKGFSEKNTIDIKANQSQVTEIDKEAEMAIIEVLENGSRFKILAEETRHDIQGDTTYWVVDPLDGTTNFIRRIPLCPVSIALVENNQPVVGVIFNPMTDELFSAEKGKGASLNGEIIHCSKESSLIFINNGYDLEHKKKYAEIIKKCLKYSVRKFGTTAYELAFVAKGSADAFVAWGDELWDHAAGILLVREAGGIVTDWKGNEWNTETNYVFASNNTIHPGLQSIVESVLSNQQL